MTAVQHYRDLVGPPQVVQTEIARLTEQRVLAAMSVPRPHPDGWRVRVWYRQPASVGRPVTIAPARRVQPGLRWERLTPDQRRVAGVVAMILGGLSLLVGVAWLLVQAVTGAARWASGNVPVLLLLLLAAGVVGRLWLGRRGRSQGHSGGSGSCPGLTSHCRDCTGHGS